MATASAADLHVLASNAIKQAYLELVPQFEKQTGLTVHTTWAGTNDVVKRVTAGETYDLIIMSADAFGKLDGKLVPGSKTELVKSGIAVAVRIGTPRPDLSSGESVKQALLAARAVGYSSGPSGVYLQTMFARLDVADAIKGKCRQTPPGTPVATILRSGEIDLGFQQVSELVHEKGIDYVGPLPAEIQHVSSFAGAVHIAAPAPDNASALIALLTAPAAITTIKKHGLEPA